MPDQPEKRNTGLPDVRGREPAPRIRGSAPPLPPSSLGALSWARLLVRSGFSFMARREALDFSRESPHNVVFLRKVLAELGLAEALSDDTFTPPESTFDEQTWLMAVERCRTGAEGGASGFERIELEIMDTYMAGVVRWVNAVGLETTYSCDGHGKRPPALHLEPADGLLLDVALALLSGGHWRLRERIVQFSAGASGDLRRELLTLGEKLHQQRVHVTAFVTAGRCLAGASHKEV